MAALAPSTITRTDGSTVTYISAADTARAVRRALAAAFPGVKFGVKLRNSTWSRALDVKVPAGGPSSRDVDAVVGPFRAAGFDGSIDLQYGIDAVLDADGSVVGHWTTGTVGSMGYVPAQRDAIPAGGQLVRFGVSWVSVIRTARVVDGVLVDDGPGVY